jgi:hypothetical protein
MWEDKAQEEGITLTDTCRWRTCDQKVIGARFDHVIHKYVPICAGCRHIEREPKI